MAVELRRAMTEDVGALVARGIREVDQLEANALGIGNDIQGALSQDLEGSECYVMSDDEGPFAIGGITPSNTDAAIGVPWFVCTDDIQNHRFSFARFVRELIGKADEVYKEMVQMMWVGNTQAREFAESVGFEFDDEEDDLIDISGYQFVRFHRSRPPRN